MVTAELDLEVLGRGAEALGGGHLNREGSLADRISLHQSVKGTGGESPDTSAAGRVHVHALDAGLHGQGQSSASAPA